MKNYTQTYLRNRPLFMSLIRGREADLFSKHLPLKNPILDFGCGDGFFAKVVFESSTKIDVGVDIDKGALRLAKKEKIYKKLISHDGKSLSFKDKSFSAVFSNCVLEHVDFLDESMAEIYRVMKPGGKFICTVMTDKWEEYLFGNVFFGEFYKKWMRKIQVHPNLLTKRQWDLLFTRQGFNILKSVGYFDKKASRWMDFLHYVSTPSLINKKLFNKWVIFPQKYDAMPVDNLINKLVEGEPSVENSAALFYILKKPTSS